MLRLLLFLHSEIHFGNTAFFGTWRSVEEQAAASSSKTLPRTYPFTRRHIPDSSNWKSLNTGRFIPFSVITNIYNKKTKRPTLMELFTATGKLKKFSFWTTRDVRRTTGDTAHIDTIFKCLPHARQHWCIDILHRCNDPCLLVSEVT